MVPRKELFILSIMYSWFLWFQPNHKVISIATLLPVALGCTEAPKLGPVNLGHPVAHGCTLWMLPSSMGFGVIDSYLRKTWGQYLRKTSVCAYAGYHHAGVLS